MIGGILSWAKSAQSFVGEVISGRNTLHVGTLKVVFFVNVWQLGRHCQHL